MSLLSSPIVPGGGCCRHGAALQLREMCRKVQGSLITASGHQPIPFPNTGVPAQSQCRRATFYGHKRCTGITGTAHLQELPCWMCFFCCPWCCASLLRQHFKGVRESGARFQRHWYQRMLCMDVPAPPKAWAGPQGAQMLQGTWVQCQRLLDEGRWDTLGGGRGRVEYPPLPGICSWKLPLGGRQRCQVSPFSAKKGGEEKPPPCPREEQTPTSGGSSKVCWLR